MGRVLGGAFLKRVTNKFAAILPLCLIAACAGPVPKIDATPAAFSNVSTITVIRPPEVKRYAALNFGHPGVAFGLIGGLIAASDQIAKSDQLTEVLKRRSLSVPSELANDTAAALARLGFQTMVDDGPWEEKEDGKFTLAFEKIQSNADAVVIISPTMVGFVAPVGAGDYLPTIASVVTLVGKDRKKTLYRGFHAAGWQPKGEGWRHTPAHTTFVDFEALMDSPSRTAESLVDAASSIAYSFAIDLQRSLPAVAGAQPLTPANPKRAQGDSAGRRDTIGAAGKGTSGPAQQLASLMPEVAENSMLPAPGATYRYSWTDSQFGRRHGEYSVRVVAVTDGNIRETVRADGEPTATTYEIPALEAAFLSRRFGEGTILELAPYLLASDSTALRDAESVLNYPATENTPWKLSSPEKDWEQIHVPAGSFRALRIEIRGSRTVPYLPTWAFAAAIVGIRFRYTVWYAPDVRRCIKVRHEVWNASNNRIVDDQIELLEYKFN